MMKMLFPKDSHSLWSVGSKGGTVGELWVSSESRGCWDLRFERPLSNWKLDIVQNFLQVVGTKRINPHAVDKRAGKGQKMRLFFGKI